MKEVPLWTRSQLIFHLHPVRYTVSMSVQVKREVDSVLEMMRVYLARCQPQHLNCDGALKRDAYSQLIDSFSHVSVPPSWAIPAVLLGGSCLVGSVRIFSFSYSTCQSWCHLDFFYLVLLHVDLCFAVIG